MPSVRILYDADGFSDATYSADRVSAQAFPSGRALIKLTTGGRRRDLLVRRYHLIDVQHHDEPGSPSVTSQDRS